MVTAPDVTPADTPSWLLRNRFRSAAAVVVLTAIPLACTAAAIGLASAPLGPPPTTEYECLSEERARLWREFQERFSPGPLVYRVNRAGPNCAAEPSSAEPDLRVTSGRKLSEKLGQ